MGSSTPQAAGRRAVLQGLAAGAAAALAGCDDEPGRPGPSTPSRPGTATTSGTQAALAAGRYTVLGALSEVPSTMLAADGPGLTISTADLVAASQQSTLTRPTTDTQVPAWAQQIGGGRAGGRAALFVALADLPGMTTAARTDAVRQDIGWSVLDVERFVAVAGVPPRGSFVAVTGERLGGAAIERLPVVTGSGSGAIHTAGEGADFAVDLAGRTPARPLGSPLRMAAQGSTVAASTATPAVQGWLARPRRSAADDADLAALARALDDRRSVSAVLHRPGGAAGADDPAASDPADAGAGGGSGVTMPRFRAVGVGWRAEGGAARVVVCYTFASEAEAPTALPLVEASWRHGTASSGRPLSELVTVDALEADGPVVVVASRPTGDAPTSVYYQMLVRREPLFVPSA